jgi:hypothetical protein
MKNKTTLVLLSIFIIGLLIGCSNPSTTIPGTPIETAYPVVARTTPTQPGEGYPIVTATPYYSTEMRGPDFNINEPVKAGDTKVTGTGPADVPIILVNVSFAGELISSTTIGKDGTFEFTFETPLESATTIGIQLGDLTGTNFVATQFIYNENYSERPMVGILFDLVHVSE